MDIDKFQKTERSRGRRPEKNEERPYRLSPSRKPSRDQSRSSNCSPVTTKKSEVVEKLQEIEDLKMRLERGDSLDRTDIQLIRNKADSRMIQKRSAISQPPQINRH